MDLKFMIENTEIIELHTLSLTHELYNGKSIWNKNLESTVFIFHKI